MCNYWLSHKYIRDFHADATSKPALGFIQPPVQWVPRSST